MSAIRLFHPALVAIGIATGFVFLAACESEPDPRQQILQHLQSAEFHRSQGSLRAAILECRNVLQINPDSSRAYLELGRIALAGRDGRSALTTLTRAGELGADATEVAFAITLAHLYAGEFPQALEGLTELEGNEGVDQTEFYLRRGEAFIGLGRFDEARRDFESVEKTGPTGARAILGLAKIALAGGETAIVNEYLEEAVKLDIQNPEIWMWQARLALIRGDYVEAEDAYYSVRQWDKVDMLSPLKIETVRGLISANLRLERFDEAYRIRQEFFEQYPNSILTAFSEGLEALQTDDFETAETRLSDILDRAPDHLPSMLALGAINYSQGDLRDAEEYLSRNIEAGTAGVAARKLLALTQLRLNKPEEALTLLEGALTEAPEDGDLRALLAVTHLANGDRDASRRELNEALTLAPDNAQTLSAVAEVFVNLREYDQAKEILRRALEIDSEASRAHALYVNIHVLEDDLDVAQRLAREWVIQSPEDAMAHESVARIALERDDRATAVRELENAVSLDPSLDSAAITLARMKILDGEFDAATDLFNGVLAANPRNVTAMRGLLAAAVQKGSPEQAVQILQKRADENRAAVYPRLVLAEYYLWSRRHDEAAALAREILDQDPRSADAYLIVGSVELAKGRAESALSAFDTMTAQAPRVATGHFYRARALAETGETARARESVETALRLQANYFPARSLAATLAIRDDDFPVAAKHVERLKNDLPDASLGFELEGDLRRRQGRHQDAYTAFQTAWSKEPSRALAVKLAHTEISLDRHAQAVTRLREWLAANANDTPVRLELATILLEAGDNRPAIDEYESLLVSMPEDSAILNNLAWLYYVTGDVRALEYAEKAYSLDSRNGAVCDTLGWILVERGQVERGIATLREAARLMPNSPEVMEHLAEALDRGGLAEEAAQIRSRL